MMKQGKDNEFNVIIRQLRALRDQVDGEQKLLSAVNMNHGETRQPFKVPEHGYMVNDGFMVVDQFGNRVSDKIYRDPVQAEKGRVGIMRTKGLSACKVMAVCRAPLPIEVASDWSDLD